MGSHGAEILWEPYNYSKEMYRKFPGSPIITRVVHEKNNGLVIMSTTTLARDESLHTRIS